VLDPFICPEPLRPVSFGVVVGAAAAASLGVAVAAPAFVAPLPPFVAPLGAAVLRGCGAAPCSSLDCFRGKGRAGNASQVSQALNPLKHNWRVYKS
jgi:hypothetical protein